MMKAKEIAVLSALVTAAVVAVILSSNGAADRVELKAKDPTQDPALQQEIAKFRSKLGLALSAQKPSGPRAAMVHRAAKEATSKTPVLSAHGRVQDRLAQAIVQAAVPVKPSKLSDDMSHAEDDEDADEDNFNDDFFEDEDEDEEEHPLPDVDITKPLNPNTEHARAIAAWGRHHTEGDWEAEDQAKYDRAVSHAQIVERGSKEMYEPLKMGKGYMHDAEDSDEQFEEQVLNLVKLLEPAYMGEALDWAQSGSTAENAALRPVVTSLEAPLIKDLEMEANARVEKVVDQMAAKHSLSLEEKEKLRSHLMAPLMVRINDRVHAQVSAYVTKMAREFILKAANVSAPGPFENMAAITGAAHAAGEALPAVPQLSPGDTKMINTLDDLRTVYKSGVIDEHDYLTQKAKFLSSWLKHHVNAAGGDARRVLRIVFGGKVKGVTDNGSKRKSKIKINAKRKLRLEKGIAYLKHDKNARITRDLVNLLVSGKAQWGFIAGCEHDWNSYKCKKKWAYIKNLVEEEAKDIEREDLNRVENSEDDLSVGTKALVKHLGSESRNKFWEDIDHHNLKKGHPTKLRLAHALNKHAKARQQQLAMGESGAASTLPNMVALLLASLLVLATSFSY